VGSAIQSFWFEIEDEKKMRRIKGLI